VNEARSASKEKKRQGMCHAGALNARSLTRKRNEKEYRRIPRSENAINIKKTL